MELPKQLRRPGGGDGMNIGIRLREARRKAGLKLTHLAATAGVNKGSLKHIEDGDRRPQPWQVTALERALGLELGALTGQIALPLEWKRIETLEEIDEELRAFLVAAARRRIEIPADVRVYRSKDRRALLVTL
jgi:DNA-binding XRE family transcriptional regulator